MLKIPRYTAQERSGTSGFPLHYENDQEALERLYVGWECDQVKLVE